MLRRIQRSLAGALLGLGCLLLPACESRGDGAPGVHVTLEPESTPLAVGEAQFALTLSDAEGRPVEGAILELEGNMNHAGMVPVFSDVEEIGEGRYSAPLDLTMGGDWFVIVRGELVDGRTLERTLEIPTVGTGDCCSVEALLTE